MAKKKTKKKKLIETLTHNDASRKNIPTAEYQSVMNKDDLTPIQVRSEFEIAQEIQPGYKATKKYLKKIEEAISTQELEVLYAEGEKLFNEGKYEVAGEKFMEADNIHLGYKSVKRYFKKIKKKVLTTKNFVEIGG